MVICTQKINEGYKYFPDVKGLMQFCSLSRYLACKKPAMKDVRWLEVAGVLLLASTLVTTDTPEPNVRKIRINYNEFKDLYYVCTSGYNKFNFFFR